jgi:hypothetical protein
VALNGFIFTLKKKKAKFALRAKITASQESSWRGKHQPSMADQPGKLS